MLRLSNDLKEFKRRKKYSKNFRNNTCNIDNFDFDFNILLKIETAKMSKNRLAYICICHLHWMCHNNFSISGNNP